MTIKTDATTRAKTYDVTSDIDPLYRMVHRDLNGLGGQLYQNATLDAVDEVQDITSGDRTGGTFDLDFTLEDGQTFSVDGLAFNAAASAVQTAVDAAAALAITGYTAGDIAVTGGAFGASGSDTTFTFSGTSVRGDHPLISVDGASLTGGATDPSPSEDTAGVVPRFWFAALKAFGVITGTDPAFGAAPNGQYTVRNSDELENYPRQQTIKALIKEATVVEGQDWETELLPLLNLDG